jgi:hypothetical protein
MPTRERRRRAQLKAADDRVTRLRLHEIIAVGECASVHPGGATSERSAMCEFGQRGASFIQTYMSISTALAALDRYQTGHADGPATDATLPARLIARSACLSLIRLMPRHRRPGLTMRVASPWPLVPERAITRAPVRSVRVGEHTETGRLQLSPVVQASVGQHCQRSRTDHESRALTTELLIGVRAVSHFKPVRRPATAGLDQVETNGTAPTELLDRCGGHRERRKSHGPYVAAAPDKSRTVARPGQF